MLVIPSIKSDQGDAVEECNITDPAAYNFNVNLPLHSEIPDKWFKKHPSYRNHTKRSFSKFVGKEFPRFLATVASWIPNYLPIPNILLHPISSASTNMTEGELWILREILAQPHNITVYSDWGGENLVIKFILELTGLKLRYQVKSVIPKVEGPVEWKLIDNSYLMAKMRIHPRDNCPISFEENEVQTVFSYTRYSKGRREQLWHLTVLVKCYLNFFVERAMYSSMKQLWNVLKRTLCQYVKSIYERSETSAEEL
ncbi:hypothetical protein GE061_004359 [Apolygus lucorum]|uniref:Uncharacterized protein n=1 Tax=Apolygus lucorum TaxID=248454 RepID=A0A6A4J8C6_APOLU|nr:hypothetical protein GE061_004359 [Apolygus lucorum]